MALAFLNLELERATESTLMTSLDLDNSGALDFREFVALVRRLSRLPLPTRPPLLITPNPNPEPQTLTLTLTPKPNPDPNPNPEPRRHPIPDQVRRLSRLPLLTRLFQKYNGDERYMSHEVFDTLWRREQAGARARASARARARAR